MQNNQEQFTKPDLSYREMDNFHQRSSIIRALNMVLPELHGEILDVGCGKMPYRDYILSHSRVEKYTGLEYEGTFDKSCSPDVFWDGQRMPFEQNSFDCVISTEVLEHVYNPEIMLAEILRILKPGGIIFLTTPFVWNLHERPFDYYRYTPFSLEKILEEAGFEDIKISALGGWHASLAQMLGLWCKRSGLGTFKRRIFSVILKPVIRLLLKNDRIDPDFNNNTMFTGLAVSAKKI
jgi:SAM-dependent methyltransferase